MGSKKALVVGINYIGTGNDLKGCLNDAANVQQLLESRGFAVETVLEKAATTAGIKAALERLVSGAVPGDVIVFHYSGHGSQLPSKVESDGWEEIICPIDLNWTTRVITDDTLRQVFNSVPNGVNTTVILDCCHSGDALDQDAHFSPVKSISPPSAPTEGSRYLAPPSNIEALLEGRETVQWAAEKDINASALLVAGCRSDQTSADALINGTHQGAATAAILDAVNRADGKITYKQLIADVNEYMVANKFEQRPQLDGFTGLHDQLFIEPFGTEIAPAPVVVPPSPPVATPHAKLNITALVVLAVIIFAGLIAFL